MDTGRWKRDLFGVRRGPWARGRAGPDSAPAPGHAQARVRWETMGCSGRPSRGHQRRA